jgi:F0F1-type ATP synthase assembly protein I
MQPHSNPGSTGSDLAGIGIYLAAAVLLPLIGGVLLDNVLHTAPVFVLVGLFVGLAAGGIAIWLKVRELSK